MSHTKPIWGVVCCLDMLHCPWERLACDLIALGALETTRNVISHGFGQKAQCGIPLHRSHGQAIERDCVCDTQSVRGHEP